MYVSIYNKLIPNIGGNMIEIILLIFIGLPLILFAVLGIHWAIIELIINIKIHLNGDDNK